MVTYGIFSALTCPYCDVVGRTYSVAYSASVLKPQTFNGLTAYSAHFGLLPYFTTIRFAWVSLRSSTDPPTSTEKTPSMRKALPSGVTNTQRPPIVATLKEAGRWRARGEPPPT